MKNFTLTFLSALCLVSCVDYGSEPAVVSEEPHEGATLRSLIKISPDCKASDIDVLIYSGSGVRALEKHIHYTAPFVDDSIEVSPGPHTAVAVSNAPGRLNDSALSRYDAVEELKFPFAQENPDYPSGSCIVQFEGGEDLSLDPEPLMCSIGIGGIESDINIYDMELYLLNVPYECEVLKWQGFHCSQMLCPYSPDEAGTLSHPEMIYRILEGFQDWRYTLYPGITFNCYPNDADEGDLGSPRTRIALKGLVSDGITVTYESELPALERGSSITLWLEIAEEGSWDVRYFENK